MLCFQLFKFLIYNFICIYFISFVNHTHPPSVFCLFVTTHTHNTTSYHLGKISRLLLGQNNSPSPVGEMVVHDNPSKLMEENLKIYNAWFESWLLNHVPKLMDQNKWFNGDNLQVGDIVLFTKTDSAISSRYQYGMITKVKPTKDRIVRKVQVK